MSMGPEKFVSVAGIKTRYFEQGQGENLVLFHGGEFTTYYDGAHSAEDWDLNFEGLGQWFHVYAVDKLGQGYTENPKTPDEYTMAAVLQHAYEFLLSLGLRDVILVGHSRGGYLVARLALEHPELVKSCILVDSGTLAPGPTRNRLVLAGLPGPRLSWESQKWVLERYSFRPDHITDQFLEAMCRIATLPQYQEAKANAETVDLRATYFLPQLSVQKDETLIWLQLGRLKTPTLLIWGYNDPTAPISMAYALFDLIAGSGSQIQMHIFNQAGHFSFREHPEEFNQVIRSFTQQI